jgi:hypothetical protein
MDQIDITIDKVCTVCRTKTPLRYGPEFVTLSEHTTIDIRIDPDEFFLCATCGNSLRLHIQAQPYELVNHLDTPIARALYEQQLRDEKDNVQ